MAEITRADSGEKHEVHNKLILSSAIQLGVDITRELLDTGALSDEVKGEHVNVQGIRTLLTATIVSKLKSSQGDK